MTKKNQALCPRGSKWRKWDLHVHPPGTKLYDGYKDTGNEGVLDKFCQKLEESDVEVFGITDYFSVDGYKSFIEKFKKNYPNSKKKFFLNIELRLNESVNKRLEEVNIHLIFNPDSIGKVDKFLQELKVVKTGKDQVPIKCAELKTKEDYESATTTRDYINEAFKNTFGEKAVRRDHFLVFSAANYDGLRPERGLKRKEIISDEIDKFSDGFFGGIQNQDYFLKTDRLEDKDLTVGKKPVISGSDAHSFDELDKFLRKRVIERNKEGAEIIIKDITWIKADPTFEGLKQILYEPEPGERVWIGPTLPDQKNDYQLIKKIKFSNTEDFPEEVIFNKNLCSVIGSRSSGKSALLAYIAHAVDKDLAESLIAGPGEGDEYTWDKIKKSGLKYEVEWANGLTNDKSNGKIVFIPQNYLFRESKNPDEIKKRIEPVLFKKFPEFKTKYEESVRTINTFNNKIIDLVKDWFKLSDDIENVRLKIKDLGDKRSIEKEKKETEQKISIYKKKYSLSEEETERYREIKKQISDLEDKIKHSHESINKVYSVLGSKRIFSDLKLELEPELYDLPQELIEKIFNKLDDSKSSILDDVNKIVGKYVDSLEKAIEKYNKELQKVKNNSKTLLDKYGKQDELEKLIKVSTKHEQTLKEIDVCRKIVEDKEEERRIKGKSIKEIIDKRRNALDELKNALNSISQDDGDIKFLIEDGIKKENIEKASQKINLKEVTNFVKDYKLKIENIREKPEELLSDLYYNKQKINKGFDKKEIATELLTLTEDILFVGEMEGDRIGGFSETTMTPGRRALFY